MEEIHHILEILAQGECPDVLATIVKVEGSAYRREGTVMLFRESGAPIGCLAAGCLEADLAERSRALVADPERFYQGLPAMYTYDMRAEDDLSWGQGAGCNGLVHVLLEPVCPPFREHLIRTKEYLGRRTPVLMVRWVRTGESLFLTAGGDSFGTWRGEAPPAIRSLWEEARPFRRQSGFRTLDGLADSVYVQFFWPKPRLVLFGAGVDARPLAELAAQTGFAVTLSDWRPAYLDPVYFPHAETMPGLPSEVLERLDLRPDDFVLIMTHNFGRDQELLAGLSEQELRYLGVLGPRGRTVRLLGGQPLPDRVHSPVGLPIGAEGPEEIAVAVVAEFIWYLRHGGRP